MLKNGDETHLSSAAQRWGDIIYTRETGTLIAKVYSEVASPQAEQSNGEYHVRLPRYTVAFGQIDLGTGGEWRPDDAKRLIPPVTGYHSNHCLKTVSVEDSAPLAPIDKPPRWILPRDPRSGFHTPPAALPHEYQFDPTWDRRCVFGNDSRRTPTSFLWVTKIATWAGIHDCDQLKVCSSTNQYLFR
jgi:hypothetical protein